MRKTQNLTGPCPLPCFEALSRIRPTPWKDKQLRGLKCGLNFKQVFKAALRHRIRKTPLEIRKVRLNVLKIRRGM